MFKKLKQFGQALSPENVKRGLAASREAMANGGRLSPEQLATLTPEQRAQYEAGLQRTQQAADDAIANDLARRVLLGPAGDYLYGPPPDREQMTSVDIGQQIADARASFKQALRDTVRLTPVPPPAVTAISANPAEQSAYERAQRDEARTPYLAPDRSPVVVTRIATDRKRPLEELCAWLGSSGLASRPDLVYGIARVPDHVPGKLGIGRAAIVEWEIVHAATVALPPTTPATAAAFDATETWAARRPGEPSVLDEDLGLEYLKFAGLGSEQCLGIARQVVVDASGGGGDDGSDPYVLVGVTGVVVVHPSGLGAGAADRMRAGRLLQVVPPADVGVAVLNWLHIRRVLTPRPDKRPLVPSPFPYLPGTGTELLEAYLSIVGVHPQDCYSAQVTEDHPNNIIGGTTFTTTTGAEKEPAADGEMRKRFRGGSRVVVAYRDSPAYAAGRERWEAYERNVLRTQLGVGTSVREPVERQSALDRGVLGAVIRTADRVDDLVNGFGVETTDFDKVPRYRYCWPPVQ